MFLSGLLHRLVSSYTNMPGGPDKSPVIGNEWRRCNCLTNLLLVRLHPYVLGRRVKLHLLGFGFQVCGQSAVIVIAVQKHLVEASLVRSYQPPHPSFFFIFYFSTIFYFNKLVFIVIVIV